ncbi:MAG: glycosyltransferase family 39 protein [Roseburia sp.]|nr:glycosyltransferase family 39 protein [Roseburia sp.]
MKSGYYVDEGMTLFLANGHYNGAVTSRSEYGIDAFIRTYIVKEGSNPIQAVQNVWGMLNELLHAGNYSVEGTVKWYDDARRMLQGNTEWVSGDALLREMVADKGERFQYTQVYLNQAMDVHPCFYYILVHTVFSVFAGIYSDAFLFGINMIFLLMTCLVIYCMVKECMEDEIAAFLAVVLFGFSQGFASCAVYFRMYAVLTFFVVMTLYLHLKLWGTERESIGRGRKIAMGATVLLGFNTHYYYILFLFPLFLLTCIRLKKKRALCRSYIKCMIATGLISLIIWPFSVYHIFFGYRGTEAVSNVFADGLLKHLYAYAEEFGKAFFSGNAGIGIILLSAAVIFCLMVWRKRRSDKGLIMGMLVPGVVYFVFIAQIAPVVSDRYIMCLFPYVAVLMAITISGIIGRLCKARGRIIVALVLGVVYAAIGFSLNVPNYLYLEQRGKELALYEDKKAYNCVMLGFDHGQGFPVARKLSEFGQVIVAGQQEIDNITSPGHTDAGTVVYVYEGLELSKCLEELEKNIGLGTDYAELESDIESFRAFLYK